MLIDGCIKANFQEVLIPKALLQDAQVFVFNHETTKAIRKLTENIPHTDIQKQFKPPYPITWIEEFQTWHSPSGDSGTIRHGWLIHENPRDGVDYNIYAVSGLGDSPTCTEMMEIKGGEQRVWDLSYGGIKDGAPVTNEHPSEFNPIEDLWWPVHAMQIYMFGLNFRELVEIKREDFTRLNKKRVNGSKLPLKDRNIVTIKLEEKRYISGESLSEGDKRKSPRMHLRRGHFMKRNEEFIWRRAALVGNKNYIPKSYEMAE